jgi:heat shock protein HslJ
MQRRARLSVLVVAVIATGCASAPAPSDPAPSAGMVVGDWLLSGGTIAGAAAPVLDDHRITLTITGSRISGTAACNSYGGELVSGSDGLHLENLAQTEMACEEPAMAAEAAFMSALARVRQIRRDGEELVARGEGVELRFTALAPPPTAELVGTAWILDTILVGDVASSPMGEPATLEFRADGTFTGSTGCRSFSGQWVEQGDQIIAPSWEMDASECAADIRAQDDHVVSVIGDGFIPTIDGQLLTLVEPGGVGLVYRAGE